VVAIDLGKGQIANARRKDVSSKISFLLGDASHTAMPDRSFDLVIIVLALHEMVRKQRIAVLREAARNWLQC